MFAPMDLADCATLAIFAPDSIYCTETDRDSKRREYKRRELCEFLNKDASKYVYTFQRYMYKHRSPFINDARHKLAIVPARAVDPVIREVSRLMERETVEQWAPISRRESVESSRNAATLKMTDAEKREKARIADYARCPATLELSRLTRKSSGNHSPNWHVLLTSKGTLKSETAYDATRVTTIKKNHHDSSLRNEGVAIKLAGESVSDYRPTHVSETRQNVSIPKKSPLAKLYRALTSATLDSQGNVVINAGGDVYRTYALSCINNSRALFAQLCVKYDRTDLLPEYASRLIVPSHDLKETYTEHQVRGKKKDRKSKAGKSVPFKIACEKPVPLETIREEEHVRDVQRAARDDEPHKGSIETGINRATGKPFTRVVLPARENRTKVESCPKHAARALSRYDHPHAKPTKRHGTLRLQTSD